PVWRGPLYPMPTPPSPLSPEVLEKLRRGVPLRLTRLGRFEFDGDPITHARTEAALRAGLDSTEDGETIVFLGPQWCYLEVEDTPLRIQGVDLSIHPPTLQLDDGRTLPLDPASLWEESGQGLRAAVPARQSGRPLSARFTNAAQMQLSVAITWEDDAPL